MGECSRFDGLALWRLDRRSTRTQYQWQCRGPSRYRARLSQAALDILSLLSTSLPMFFCSLTFALNGVSKRAKPPRASVFERFVRPHYGRGLYVKGFTNWTLPKKEDASAFNVVACSPSFARCEYDIRYSRDLLSGWRHMNRYQFST